MVLGQGVEPSVPLTTRLVGPRIVLRAPRASDIAALRALLCDNAEHLRPVSPAAAPGTDPLSLTEVGRAVLEQRAEWKRDRAYTFLITERDRDNAPLGRVRLGVVARGVFQNAYLGYWMGREHQGRGYMTEAVRLACDAAFGVLELHRVQAAVIPDNVASRRVLEKAGFREEGFARRYLCIAGAWRDHVLYARTVEDG